MPISLYGGYVNDSNLIYRVAIAMTDYVSEWNIMLFFFDEQTSYFSTVILFSLGYSLINFFVSEQSYSIIKRLIRFYF